MGIEQRLHSARALRRDEWRVLEHGDALVVGAEVLKDSELDRVHVERNRKEHLLERLEDVVLARQVDHLIRGAVLSGDRDALADLGARGDIHELHLSVVLIRR